MNVQQICPPVLTETAMPIPAAAARGQRDRCRSEILAEDLERVARAEQAVRALERQRELARQQALARYD